MRPLVLGRWFWEAALPRFPGLRASWRGVAPRRWVVATLGLSRHGAALVRDEVALMAVVGVGVGSGASVSVASAWVWRRLRLRSVELPGLAVWCCGWAWRRLGVDSGTEAKGFWMRKIVQQAHYWDAGPHWNAPGKILEFRPLPKVIQHSEANLSESVNSIFVRGIRFRKSSGGDTCNLCQTHATGDRNDMW